MIPKSHSVHPLPPPPRRVERPTKFSNSPLFGGLDGTSAFRGGLLRKRGMTFFKGGCNLYIKINLKIRNEMFNDKKSL